MPQFITDLVGYIRDVFVEGTQWILTIFEILGVVTFLYPDVAQWATSNEEAVRSLAGSVAAACFVVANFRVYRRAGGAGRPRFDIVEVLPPMLGGKPIRYSGSAASIEERLTVGVIALATVGKSGPSTAVDISVESIDPPCLPDGVSAGDLKVSLREIKGPQGMPVDVDNPLYLRDNDTRKIQLQVSIPLQTHCLEAWAGSLANLGTMRVVLALRPEGSRPVTRTVECDLSGVRRWTEESLATKIQHMQGTSPSGLLQVVKRFYGPHSH
jgi:hypothetical protein